MTISFGDFPTTFDCLIGASIGCFRDHTSPSKFKGTWRIFSNPLRKLCASPPSWSLVFLFFNGDRWRQQLLLVISSVTVQKVWTSQKIHQICSIASDCIAQITQILMTRTMKLESGLDEFESTVHWLNKTASCGWHHHHHHPHFRIFFVFFVGKSTSHGKSTINWPSSAASKNLIPRVPRVVHWKKSPSCGSGRRSRRYVTNFAGFQKQVVISNTCYPLLSKICETCCNTNTCHCFCRV